MSLPFYGEKFTFVQADGGTLDVRGWGNQNHAVFETLDGYTVVNDPVTGFHHYARLSDDGTTLLPLGPRVGTAQPRRSSRNGLIVVGTFGGWCVDLQRAHRQRRHLDVA